MSDVFFASSNVGRQKSLEKGFGSLIDRIGLDCIGKDDLTAIKLHFGERGNTAFIRPFYFGVLVDRVKAKGGKPFLTDTNTLYRGMRMNGVDHLELAVQHGFTYSVVGAPVIIADGIRSQDWVEKEVHLKHFKTVRFASNVRHADTLIGVAHFKGHLAVGFGGAIKNIGMGIGSRAAKQQMHADVKPQFASRDACTGCGECMKICPAEAIRMEKGKAVFDLEKCIGCAECITICPNDALRILWNESPEGLGEKIAETAWAVLREKKGKAVFFNFLLEITPDCDCFPSSDNPIVQDIGILASRDVVSIDQASADLVNDAEGLPHSILKSHFAPGEDKFRALYPKVDWRRQLEYAEEIGLGERAYRLIDI
jgi:hypothetical protein